MSEAISNELTRFLHAFRHRLTSTPTSAEAETWWPLALGIDASMGVADVGGANRRQASRALIWAVSDVIRMLKTSDRPDVGRVCTALADLEQLVAASWLHPRTGDEHASA